MNIAVFLFFVLFSSFSFSIYAKDEGGSAGGNREFALHLDNEISLLHFDRNSVIVSMAFSPDGKLLAVEINPEKGRTEVQIMNIADAKLISIIPVSSFINIYTDHSPYWLNNNILMLGARYQWDVASGRRLPDLPVVGRNPRFDREGSRLFTIEGAVGAPSYFHVYDTQTWGDQRFSAQGFSIESAAWTADGNLLMSLGSTREIYGKTIEGHHVASGFDRALRVFSLKQKDFTQTVWFPVAAADRPGALWPQRQDINLGISCYSQNLILMSVNKFINGGDLSISEFYENKEIKQFNTALLGGYACAPNGRYFFIKDINYSGSGHHGNNAVVDLPTKKIIYRFRGGDTGIAVDEKEKRLAIGSDGKVIFYRIKN